MAFTYSELLASPRDRIRHLLGDTKSPGLRSDETIDALVVQEGEALATAILAEGLASEFAQRPSNLQIPGQIGMTWGDRVKQWQDLSAQIRDRESEILAASSRAKLATFTVARADADEETAEYRALLYFPGGPYDDAGSR